MLSQWCQNADFAVVGTLERSYTAVSLSQWIQRKHFFLAINILRLMIHLCTHRRISNDIDSSAVFENLENFPSLQSTPLQRLKLRDTDNFPFPPNELGRKVISSRFCFDKNNKQEAIRPRKLKVVLIYTYGSTPQVLFSISQSVAFLSQWRRREKSTYTGKKTSQELRMLSSVTINCQITKIVMISGSQLSELLSVSQMSQVSGLSLLLLSIIVTIVINVIEILKKS